jgi:undecaprenyl-diphosphatase
MSHQAADILRTLATRHGRTLLAVLAIVLGVWGLISLTDTVQEGHTQKFDMRVILWFVHHPGPAWLSDMARDITALGGVAVLTLVTLAVVGYLIIIIARKRGAAMLVVVAVVGGLLIGSLLKHFIDRDRPPREFQTTYVFTHSFPSGHSMLSAVTYLTLGALLAQVMKGRLLKLYFVTLALVLTFLVGLSRVYLRVHWPTDVLAGWTAGLVWAILCLLIARLLQQKGAVEKEDSGSTG